MLQKLVSEGLELAYSKNNIKSWKKTKWPTIIKIQKISLLLEERVIKYRAKWHDRSQNLMTIYLSIQFFNTKHQYQISKILTFSDFSQIDDDLFNFLKFDHVLGLRVKKWNPIGLVPILVWLIQYGPLIIGFRHSAPNYVICMKLIYCMHFSVCVYIMLREN